MKTLKLAVIGAGHLGRIHARLASQLEAVELVGIVDPDENARREVAAQAGAPGFADCRTIIDHIDAAIVATPTTTHHAVALELLRKGIHVLVEKPITSTVEQAEELVEQAEQHGAILQVGHVERFNPALARVLPDLVDPKYCEASRVSGYPFRSTDVGVVLDLMIHDLDIILAQVSSPVVRVDALGISVLGKHEDAAQARLEFENGAVAQLAASRISYTSARTLQAWTPRSFVSIDFGMRTTTVVRPKPQILEREFDLDSLSPQQETWLKQHMFEHLFQRQTIDGAEGNPLLEEQRDLVESIRTGRAPRVTGAQGRDVLVVAEQILEKIEQHQWDGFSGGRIGPLVTPTVPILRTGHWDFDQASQDTRHREAG